MSELTKRLLAVLFGFAVVPVAMALLRPGLDLLTGKPDVLETLVRILPSLALITATELAVGVLGLVVWRPEWLRRLLPLLTVSALASLSGWLLWALLHPEMEVRWRFLIGGVVGSPLLGLSSLAALAWLEAPLVPPRPDPLKSVGLATPETFEQLGAGKASSYQVHLDRGAWLGWLVVALALGMFVADPVDWFPPVLALLGLYCVAVSGRLELSPQSLIHRNWFGTAVMPWGDVLGVKVPANGDGMVLVGDVKRLRVPNLWLWGGPQARDAKRLLAEIFKARALVPETSAWAAFMGNRNVRCEDLRR